MSRDDWPTPEEQVKRCPVTPCGRCDDLIEARREAERLALEAALLRISMASSIAPESVLADLLIERGHAGRDKRGHAGCHGGGA